MDAVIIAIALCCLPSQEPVLALPGNDRNAVHLDCGDERHLHQLRSWEEPKFLAFTNYSGPKGSRVGKGEGALPKLVRLNSNLAHHVGQ